MKVLALKGGEWPHGERSWTVGGEVNTCIPSEAGNMEPIFD